MNSSTHSPSSQTPSERKPRAWMRRWVFDGESKTKVRGENGRMKLAGKFKFLPVTEFKMFDDDVPLYDAIFPLGGITLPEPKTQDRMSPGESEEHYARHEGRVEGWNECLEEVARSVGKPQPVTKQDIDDIVYRCRQSGDDSTYAIVQAVEALHGIGATAPAKNGA